MTYIHKYTIERYNNDEDKNEVVSGIVVANNYHEAVSLIEDYYGEDNVITILLLEGYDLGDFEGTGIIAFSELLDIIKGN